MPDGGVNAYEADKRMLREMAEELRRMCITGIENSDDLGKLEVIATRIELDLTVAKVWEMKGTPVAARLVQMVGEAEE